jgi:hypothetical protein
MSDFTCRFVPPFGELGIDIMPERIKNEGYGGKLTIIIDRRDISIDNIEKFIMKLLSIMSSFDTVIIKSYTEVPIFINSNIFEGCSIKFLDMMNCYVGEGDLKIEIKVRDAYLRFKLDDLKRMNKKTILTTDIRAQTREFINEAKKFVLISDPVIIEKIRNQQQYIPCLSEVIKRDYVSVRRGYITIITDPLI